MAQGLQIGQVARETGLTVDAIRFYEKQRLLKRPMRTEGGFRLFSSQVLQSIHFIRRAQELGFSLNEIPSFSSSKARTWKRARTFETFSNRS